MNDPSEYKIYYKDDFGKNQQLYGVNNLSLVKRTSYANEYLLGGIIPASSLNSPEQLELSFDRSFVSQDNLFKYTGFVPIKQIHIAYEDKKYSLRDLYLNSYSAGFSIGELPKVNTKFTSYGGELFYPEDELGTLSENLNEDKSIMPLSPFSPLAPSLPGAPLLPLGPLGPMSPVDPSFPVVIIGRSAMSKTSPSAKCSFIRR